MICVHVNLNILIFRWLACDDFCNLQKRKKEKGKSNTSSTDQGKKKETQPSPVFIFTSVKCPFTAFYNESAHAYPGREVHRGAPVQKQCSHVDVPVVGSDVQRGEAALESKGNSAIKHSTCSVTVTGQ